MRRKSRDSLEQHFKKLDKRLFQACESRDQDVALSLIETGADVKRVLLKACRKNKPDMVRFLSTLGVTNLNDAALEATKMGKINIVRLAFQLGATCLGDAFSKSICQKDLPMADFLLEKMIEMKTPISYSRSLSLAVRQDAVQIVDLILTIAKTQNLALTPGQLNRCLREECCNCLEIAPMAEVLVRHGATDVLADIINDGIDCEKTHSSQNKKTHSDQAFELLMVSFFVLAVNVIWKSWLSLW